MICGTHIGGPNKVLALVSVRHLKSLKVTHDLLVTSVGQLRSFVRCVNLLVVNHKLFIFHLYLKAPMRMLLSEFCDSDLPQKNRKMSIPGGEISLNNFYAVPECDRQTDRQTILPCQYCMSACLAHEKSTLIYVH